jgi:hypothetical protein
LPKTRNTIPLPLRLKCCLPSHIRSDIQSGTRSLRIEVYDGSPDGGGSFLGATELSLSALAVNANAEDFTLPLSAQLAATEVQKGTVTISCRLTSQFSSFARPKLMCWRLLLSGPFSVHPFSRARIRQCADAFLDLATLPFRRRWTRGRSSDAKPNTDYANSH